MEDEILEVPQFIPSVSHPSNLSLVMPIMLLMYCFHWNRQAGNYAFLESRDHRLHVWLGSVASYWPVGESR